MENSGFWRSDFEIGVALGSVGFQSLIAVENIVFKILELSTYWSGVRLVFYGVPQKTLGLIAKTLKYF